MKIFKHYKYLAVLIVCITMIGFVSKALADGPTLDGLTPYSSDTTNQPAVDPSTSSDSPGPTLASSTIGSSDVSSSTPVDPTASSSDISSSTSVVPPLFGSNDTSVSMSTLTINVTGGSVSSDDKVISADGSIDCVMSDTSCTLSTTTDPMIVLTAIASGTDTFSGWSSNPSGICADTASSTCSFLASLADDTSVTATFATTTAITSVVVVNQASIQSFSSGSSGGYSSGGGNEYVPLAVATASSSNGTLGNVLSCPLLTNYIIPGRVNNSNDISKLQIFLNVNDQANLTVNGILNTATENAIKVFQAKYLSQVMGPWGLNVPSGEVYITTLKEINSITCGTSITLSAQDLAIINAYKAQVAQGQQTTANNALSTPSITPTTITPTTLSASTTSNTAVSATTSTTTGNANSALVGNAISVTNNGFFSRIFSAIAHFFGRN